MSVESQLSPLSLTTARSMRLLILAKIETTMKRLSIQEESLKKLLRKSVPKSVARFLDDKEVIEDLFKHGGSSRKVRYSDNLYGFKNAKQVKDAFWALKKAWKDAVKITFFERGSDGIEISINVP